MSPIELMWTAKNANRDACSTADIFIHCHQFENIFIHLHPPSGIGEKFPNNPVTFFEGVPKAILCASKSTFNVSFL